MRPESIGLPIPIPIRAIALWIEIGLQNGESIGRFNPIQRLCGLHFVQSGDCTRAMWVQHCTRAIGSAIASAILGGEMGGARGAPLGALGVGTFLPRGRTRPRAPFQAEGAQIGAQGPASRGRQKTHSQAN